MSIEGLIITILILGITAYLLLLPFIRREHSLSGTALAKFKDQEALLTAYERILGAIRDLDEDFALGKLRSETYIVERQEYAAQGAAILQALEQHVGQKLGSRQRKAAPIKAVKAQPHTTANPEAVLDDEIEEAIAHYIAARQSAGD